MAEMSTEAGSPCAGIDLSQFHQVFFEEAGENLERLEQLLLGLDMAAPDDEELNAIFRGAHSIKGGAATFGFAEMAELTHHMETLLDKLRRHELAPTAEMVDVLLASGDALKTQLAGRQGASEERADTAGLLARIGELVAGERPANAGPEPEPKVDGGAAAEHGSSGKRVLELTIGPLENPAPADSVVELFKEITDLGSIEAVGGGSAQHGLHCFKVVTASTDTELLDLFSFHVGREQVKFLPWGGEPVAPGYGFFDGTPGAPTAVATGAATPDTASAKAEPKAVASLEATTLRVSVEKVDQLINLMGELVITQAMLAQTGAGAGTAGHQKLAVGLADLERNTRDLQAAVMAIRMIPMSVVFSRFPRMLRDLAGKLGKRVELITEGESTELDKGMIEKITDPLMHLVRNSCDHGIETPEERRAKGKPEAGTIMLAASHQGGSIVIEVRDDGRGLSRDKLLKKACEKGIETPDMPRDAEVWALIFAPGFSTADVVTDVSGRGVGMDVVKKNITALGGTVEIDSTEGRGMSVKVRLPLTLAIMESISVGVGAERYILPLSSVIESFQPTAERVKTVGGDARLVRVRDEYLPVIELQQVFEVPRLGDPPAQPVMVVIEAEGVRAALLVDEILGQQQVVVKNLEANFRRVDHVAGATIMGDGRVALILDVGALMRRQRH
ncbi:MAG: chemotaxis protein CheW [Proteobacteria bacterium]|nr:chemotaxis protein CheW [Pseudomonadota bacterium]